MATKRGLSVHVGLNAVDPSGYYAGWSGELAACEFDAKDMAALAKKGGFTTQTMLTKKGTVDAVTTAIADAAGKLRGGDTFLLTYSGHGSQMPDVDGDEVDGADETWVLYDRELLDDELYVLWGRFAEGVKIVVLSDSCHSGSVVREFRRTVRPSFAPAESAFRTMPLTARAKVDKRNAAANRDLQRATPKETDVEVGASVLLLSGCQDNQTSLDGDRNGAFTGTVRSVWNNGKFKGSYRGLWRAVARQMPFTQSPNWFTTGVPSRALQYHRPFEV